MADAAWAPANALDRQHETLGLGAIRLDRFPSSKEGGLEEHFAWVADANR